jgi:hypothetical protein
MSVQYDDIVLLLRDTLGNIAWRYVFTFVKILFYFTQWPRCLRRRSAASCLLGSRVRIPLGE